MVAPAAIAGSFSPYFDLTMLGDVYLLPVSRDYNNGQLHGRFKLLSQEEFSEIYLDLGAGGLVGERAESYLIMPQAYWTYRLNPEVSFTAGRVVKPFSNLDDYWMLGDVQPLFRWDAARPEIQGLTGLFLEWKPNSNFQVDLYASGLYIPQQGPSFSAADGKITSGNPWFSRPVDILSLSGQPYDLNFTVKTPDVSDIVFQPSWGAVVTTRSDSEMLWARAGYFVKSRNELITPFEGTINLGTNEGDIVVHPVVAEHKITTADFGFKSERFAATLSGINESDVRFDVQSQWIYPDYSDQYKVGLNLLYQLTPFHTLEVGGLRTFKNSVAVRGLAGADTLDVYSFRNQYDNAADLRLTSVFVPRKHGFLFKTRLRYAYDYRAETSLLSAELTYSPLEELSCFMRTDFFGGDRPTQQIYNNMLVNYLNKDRAQVGVKYVF